ncbi:aldo-keto reductase family 1 member A1-like [Oratosquilla oratoria]|uniref:aldo-keto reductase family 1 member A1-like n=1 Tax=Oratosquilla oratoria TaxID=337810 RepID=UPI003F75AF3A
MATKIPCVELHTGQKMPVIGMGTFKVKHDEGRVAFNAALECGYRHIDTAYMYFNEEVIGEVLSAWFESGRLKREDVFITTKLPLIGNRKEDVSRFLQKSLDSMRISYVDLYLIHSPIGLKWKNDMDTFALSANGECSLEIETDLEELWKGMEAQVDSGKAKAIGLSNFNSKQIERIMTASRIKPAILQVEVHAHHLQKPLRKVCEQNGIIVCGYAPLGAPYKHEDEGLVLLKNPVVLKIAAHHKKTNAQVLLRHLIQHDIVIIPKSSNAERLKENLEVFDFELTAEEMGELDSLDLGKKGKLFTFSNFKGLDKHPEYPFHIPY